MRRSELVTHSEGRSFVCHHCGIIMNSSEELKTHHLNDHPQGSSGGAICDTRQRKEHHSLLEEEGREGEKRKENLRHPSSFSSCADNTTICVTPNASMFQPYNTTNTKIDQFHVHSCDPNGTENLTEMKQFNYKASFSRYCTARADTHYKLSFTIFVTSFLPVIGVWMFRAHPRFPGQNVIVFFVRSCVFTALLGIAACSSGPTFGVVDWAAWFHSLATYALLTLTFMIFYGWQGSVEYFDDVAIIDVITHHIDRKLFVPVVDVHGGCYYQNPVNKRQSLLSFGISLCLAFPHAVLPWSRYSVENRSINSWMVVVATFISTAALVKRAIDCLSVAAFHSHRVQRFSILTHMSFFPDTMLVHRSPVDAHDGWELTFNRSSHLVRWMSIRLYLSAVSLPFWKSMEGLMAVLVMFIVGSGVFFLSTMGNRWKSVYTIALFYDVVLLSALTFPMVMYSQRLNEVLQQHQRMIVECEYLLVLQGLNTLNTFGHQSTEQQRCYTLLRTMTHVMNNEDRVRLLGFKLTRVPQLIYCVVVATVIAGGGLYNWA